jgi:hypothetical protein
VNENRKFVVALAVENSREKEYLRSEKGVACKNRLTKNIYSNLWTNLQDCSVCYCHLKIFPFLKIVRKLSSCVSGIFSVFLFSVTECPQIFNSKNKYTKIYVDLFTLIMGVLHRRHLPVP